jgi:hypothetical protein
MSTGPACAAIPGNGRLAAPCRAAAANAAPPDPMIARSYRMSVPSRGRVWVHRACPADCGYVQVRRSGRLAWYKVAGPRVADLVMLARSLAAGNAAALAGCVRIPPDPAAETAPRP